MRKKTQNVVSEVIDDVDATVAEITTETDRFVDPYRKSFFKRFPISSLLLVTFGATATFAGLESIIADTAWLNNRPWLILSIGLFTLILTGTLYKKLG